MMGFRWARRVCVAALVLSLGGCTGFIPRSGPTAEAINNQAEFVSNESQPVSYMLIQLEPSLFPALAYDQGFGPGFVTNRGKAEIRPGVGDQLSVTVFEAGTGGLFNAGATELPLQVVDRSGFITVPYAGKIRAAGRSLSAIQTEIQNLIKDRAIDPQVIVNIREQRANQVSVLGRVTAAGTFPLTDGGMRVLDALSRAGGLSIPGNEAAVTLKRGNRTEVVAFDSIVARANNNVFLNPGDVVYVAREPRTFVALGAFSGSEAQSGRVEFEAESLSLIDALGKVRGLNDARANPSTAFVFRHERKDLLKRLGYPVDAFTGSTVPTVYRADFSSPSTYFLAGDFKVRDKDVLYVTNAPMADINKFLTFVGLVTTPIAQGAGVAGIINGIQVGSGSAIAVPTTVTPVTP
jgi:polysaccharide export outer membrane protein